MDVVFSRLVANTSDWLRWLCSDLSFFLSVFLHFLTGRVALYDEHDFMMVQNSSTSTWQ
jgi:hypothetical protein